MVDRSPGTLRLARFLLYPIGWFAFQVGELVLAAAALGALLGWVLPNVGKRGYLAALGALVILLVFANHFIRKWAIGVDERSARPGAEVRITGEAP
jgi:hypothetical protein